ncbi:hypothetical protein QAD02_001714 [Eretmocerus hayati]|uniref:Uncharacterized protein n=1 Tax=Eretmocerus hayati TaxID=131215 RepID=A0ACC2NLL6_9HYME|nr:hypothetical protein QAD02_001714 [Eretmocerus hayati]
MIVRIKISMSNDSDPMIDACLAPDWDQSDDEEISFTVNQNRKNSSSQVLPSPKRPIPKVSTRKQSLNTNAIVLNKDMFAKPQEEFKTKRQNLEKRKIQQEPSTLEISEKIERSALQNPRRKMNYLETKNGFVKFVWKIGSKI